MAVAHRLRRFTACAVLGEPRRLTALFEPCAQFETDALSDAARRVSRLQAVPFVLSVHALRGLLRDVPSIAFAAMRRRLQGSRVQIGDTRGEISLQPIKCGLPLSQ